MKTWQERWQESVTDIMYGRGRYPFWSLATALYAASLIYGTLLKVKQRAGRRGEPVGGSLPCKVISVGNIAVGGTGKTPMTVSLARMLKDAGCRVAVVSRGYKGSMESGGAVVSDGLDLHCSAREAGDEPYLMARLLDEIPVLVGRDRLKAAGLAVSRFKPDVILLDDGFQYRRLARDLDILLLDCGAPLGNGYLLPRGILREPPQAILRADAVVMTRCRRRKPAIQERIRRLVRSDALFRSVHRPLVRWTVPAMQPVGRHPGLQEKDGAAAPLKDRRIYAFSALAGNRSFFDSLAHLGAAPLESRGFPDHHAWSPAEIRGIATAARAAGCDCLVTTEKDFVRLPEETVLPLDLVVAGVDIDFGDDTGRWLRFISRRVLGDLSADGRCHE